MRSRNHPTPIPNDVDRHMSSNSLHEFCCGGFSCQQRHKVDIRCQDNEIKSIVNVSVYCKLELTVLCINETPVLKLEYQSRFRYPEISQCLQDGEQSKTRAESIPSPKNLAFAIEMTMKAVLLQCQPCVIVSDGALLLEQCNLTSLQPSR